MSTASSIASAWRRFWKPPERRPIYTWAGDHIRFGSESPFPGRFRIATTPFVKTPFDQLRRDDIEMTTLSGVAQSAKSTMASIFVADSVANNPGPCTWNSPTKDAAKKTAEKKIWPIFKRCAPILAKLPLKCGFLSIRFPDAPFAVQTASIGNADGDSVKFQINDDLQSSAWEPGMHGKFLKRTSAFSGLGRKVINLMTGCTKHVEERLDDGTVIERGDDAFELWQAGTRSLWSVVCPSCKHRQPLVWEHRGKDGRKLRDFSGAPVYGIIWDTDETTKPGGAWKDGKYAGGRWDPSAVACTARWKCIACDHEVADTRANRSALNSLDNGADYVDTNPFSEPGHWSGRYPAMASELIPWGTLVAEFLSALDNAAVGNLTPLKEFVMNRLAEAWFAGETSTTEAAASADYPLGSAWVDEAGASRVALDKHGKPRRYLVADQQKDGELFKVLVREFADGGASRLVAYYPDVKSHAEIEALRIRHEVTKPRTGLDVGDGTQVFENYSAVARYGWTGLKGDDKDGFPHPGKLAGQVVMKGWSRRWYGEPAVALAKTKAEKRKLHAAAQARGGIRPQGLALCFHWSNPLVKDYLARLRAGLGVYWGRPSEEPDEYKDGLFSEIKVEKLGRNGRRYWVWEAVKKNNHPWDLECMALVMAMMSGILAQPEPLPTSERTLLVE